MIHYKYSIFFCLAFCSVFVLTLSCSAQKIPNIGDDWNGNVDVREKIYLPPPVDLIPVVRIKREGINFNLGVQGKTIIFISTKDSSFKISGEKYIHKPLSFFKNKSLINHIPGWAYYLPLDNGWYAGFPSGKINDTTQVAFLFKYNFRHKKNIRSGNKDDIKTTKN